MTLTEKNLRVADAIVNILIKEKCTILEAQAILHEVSRGITASSMVQMNEGYTEIFSEALEPRE